MLDIRLFYSFPNFGSEIAYIKQLNDEPHTSIKGADNTR